jgi:hypothetical protein
LRRATSLPGQVLFINAGHHVRMKPFDEIAAAIEAERAAWLAVKDHLPGTEGYDPRLWDAWLGAMRRCREARPAKARRRTTGRHRRPRHAGTDGAREAARKPRRRASPLSLRPPACRKSGRCAHPLTRV